MRGLFSRVGRGVAVGAVVVALAAPAFAGPRDDEGWTPGKIIKIVKKLVVRSLGDGLIVPRP